MRFAWTACKFEGLHFCHQFFNDLLRLFDAISVGKERDQEGGNFGKNGLEGHHPKILGKALQNASLTNGGCDSVTGGSH